MIVEWINNGTADSLTALYTLERLANDNPGHRQTIVNIICAYLRMPWTPPIRNARFVGATFTGGAWFVDATFTGGAWFVDATFTGGAWFVDATFTGDALVRGRDLHRGRLVRGPRPSPGQSGSGARPSPKVPCSKV
jgi:hypothetical protein